MWEYKRIIIKFTLNNKLIETLNTYGLDGWEVINYNEIISSKFGEKNESIILLKKKCHA